MTHRMNLFLAAAGAAVSCRFVDAQPTAWLAPADGFWQDDANWSAGAPSMGVTASITAAGSPYTVSLNAESGTAGGLLLDSQDAMFSQRFSTLDLEGGVLDLRSGVYMMESSVLRNAVIDSGGGEYAFVDGTSTLENIELRLGEFVIPGGNSSPLLLEAGLKGSGGSLRIRDEAIVRAGSDMTIQSVPIVFDDDPQGDASLGALPGFTLTLDPGTSLVAARGTLVNIANQGSIIVDGQSASSDRGGRVFDGFLNAGTVSVENGGLMTFDGAALDNQSTISVQNSTVRFDTLDAGSSIGLVTANDSRVEFGLTSTDIINSMILLGSGNTTVLTGNWNNQNRSYTLNFLTGDYRLEGGIVSGGSLAFANGAALEIGSGFNALNNVEIVSGLVRSGDFGRLELRPGWQQDIASLDVDGVRLALAGQLSLPDLSRYNLFNGSHVEIAGDLDLAGGTLSPAAIGREITLSGGEISNGVIDYTGQTLVVEDRAFGGVSTSTLTNVTLRGGLAVESGIARLQGVVDVDGVEFANRSSITNAIVLDFADVDLAGKSFRVTEGRVSLEGNTEVTAGTIELAPTASLGVNEQAELVGTTVEFETGAVLNGGGYLRGVTLSGSPTIGRGSSPRVDGDLIAADPVLITGGLRVTSQARLVGDFLAPAGPDEGDVDLFPNALLHIDASSSLTGGNFEIRGDGTTRVDGLLRANDAQGVFDISSTYIEVNGQAEATDGGTLLLGDATSQFSVTGSVGAYNGGTVVVSGMFQAGDIDGAFSAPDGIFRLSGELQNAGGLLNVDSRFAEFGLGYIDEMRVFDGEIVIQPGKEMTISGGTILSGVGVTGDIAVNRRLELDNGSTVEGKIRMAEDGRMVVRGAAPAMAQHAFDISFENAGVSQRDLFFTDQGAQINLIPATRLVGSGARVSTTGVGSSITMAGLLRADAGGVPFELSSASVDLQGTTQVRRGGSLLFTDALSAQADGLTTQVQLSGRLVAEDGALISVAGDLGLGQNAQLISSISALPASALLQIDGVVDLDGLFLLDALPALSAMPGDSYVLIEAGLVQGQFAEIQSSRFSKYAPQVSYEPSRVVVTLFSRDFPTVMAGASGINLEPVDYTPVPAPAASLVFLGLCGLGRSSRRRCCESQG